MENRTTYVCCGKTGRVLATVDPLGNTTSYIYDDQGNQTGVQDPQGNISSTTYCDPSRSSISVEVPGDGIRAIRAVDNGVPAEVESEEESVVESEGELFRDPARVDRLIRQAYRLCWHSLPRDRRTVDEVERQMRRVFDRVGCDWREDGSAFGMGGDDNGTS